MERDSTSTSLTWLQSIWMALRYNPLIVTSEGRNCVWCDPKPTDDLGPDDEPVVRMVRLSSLGAALEGLPVSLVDREKGILKTSVSQRCEWALSLSNMG